MHNENYFAWLLENTETSWWHDSAEPSELDYGLRIGATGVTTNPVLVNKTIHSGIQYWLPKIHTASNGLNPQLRAETSMRVVLSEAAEKLKPIYEKTNAQQGYVCAQVNPALSGNRESMLEMARRFSAWAPNIAVKLPVTSAGLDVLEDCIAEGITVTATVSFIVPQVIAVAEKCRKGIRRAIHNDEIPGKCFAVIMIGRIDDYLRDLAMDNSIDLSESEITQAGLAIAKRAYSIYKKSRYEAVLLVAALRGGYHMTELAGAKMIMSIAPKYQHLLQSLKPPFTKNINVEVDLNVIEKLSKLRDFVRSYEPDGMPVEDFIKFGCTQRTLSQFTAAGWSMLENL